LDTVKLATINLKIKRKHSNI